jgi:hypothetical protein
MQRNIPSAHRNQTYGRDRSEFIWRACAIIFVPLVPVIVILLSPWPHTLERHRDAFSIRNHCEPQDATS